MLVAEEKPYNEIEKLLKGYNSILVVGCGGCTSLCNTGGLRESRVMALRLHDKSGKKAKAVTIERQCDDEFVEELGYHINGIDAILSLGCGAGAQLIAEQYTSIPVFPGLNTMFTGTSHERRIFIERCRSCGDCRLGLTAGICPLTRCAKGLQNGPCGGSEDGMCETGNGMECAWCLIIKRLEEQNRLHELEMYTEPVEWTTHEPGRYESGMGVK